MAAQLKEVNGVFMNPVARAMGAVCGSSLFGAGLFILHGAAQDSSRMHVSSLPSAIGLVFTAGMGSAAACTGLKVLAEMAGCFERALPAPASADVSQGLEKS